MSWINTGGHGRHHRTVTCALQRNDAIAIFAIVAVPSRRDRYMSRIARTSLPLVASLIPQLYALRTAACLPLLLPSTITIVQDT